MRTGEKVGILTKRDGEHKDEEYLLKPDGTVFDFGEARFVWADIDGVETKLYRSYSDYVG